MEQPIYEDVTSLLLQASKDLKPSQMLHTDNFSLYDSMSAIEIYDPKMDLKANLKDNISLPKLIQNKTVKEPKDLTIRELVGIFDDLLGKEMLWLSGQSLPHTVYTFCYLYEPKIYEDHKFLKPYIDALYKGGEICSELIRQSHYLREEDYIASTVGFPPGKNAEELAQNLLNAEYELEDQLSTKKKKKAKSKKPEEQKVNLNEYDALHARLKLRRGLVSLYANLQAKFTPKMRDQIQNNVASCLKTLEVVRETMEYSENCEQYFVHTLNKTLLAHIAPRPPRSIAKTDALVEVENILNGIQGIFRLADIQDFYDIQRALQNFSLVPKNILTRAYLDVNVFQKEEYFGLITIKELALSALEEFHFNKGKMLIGKEEVRGLIDQTVPVFREILSNSLRNKTKQKREIVKLYHSLNVLTHEAYALDGKIFGNEDNRVHVLFSWTFDLALKMMVKQLLLGFDLNLYTDEEYCIIFYFLDKIFYFLDRNFRSSITQFDREFLAAWQNKENVDKKKKKLTPFQRKFFYESLYYKAIENYSGVMLKLSYLLIFKGVLSIPQEEEVLKNRYYLRLRTFENVYFMGKFEFPEFVEYCKELEKADFATTLKDCKGLLESNIKLLNEISADESFDSRIKNELEKLKRICVFNSFAITKLDTNKNNLTDLKATFKNNEHPLYPILDIQKK